jgi:hypothetical protein
MLTKLPHLSVAMGYEVNKLHNVSAKAAAKSYVSYLF